MKAQTPKFQQWLAAEQAARLAERELHALIMQAPLEDTTAIPPETVLSAREKRVHAHVLFDAAMQEIKETAASLHYRRLDAR